MSSEVMLTDVVSEMDVPKEAWRAYINRKTGELYTITDEDLQALEQPEEHVPDWHREELPKLRIILQSTDWLMLPTRSEINEQAIVESFCSQLEPESLREEFRHAARSPGGIIQFMNLVEREDLEREWYAYRQESLDEIAADWLDKNGIQYKVDIPPEL